MILKKEQLEKIKKFAKEKIKFNDSWHQLFHTEQTVKLAIALARKEKVDINKCVIAAWLHDIEKNEEENGIDHGSKGAETAENFLGKIGISDKDAKDICKAIHEHNKNNKNTTKISQILGDADKLQAIGPYGLLRIYGYRSSIGTPQKDSYEINLKEQKFYTKGFYTKTAKKIAKKHFNFMKKFHKKYKQIEQAKL